MGKRGPAPMPTALRLLHGESPYRINANEPIPRDGLPTPPPDIPRPVRAVWDRTVAELDAMGVITGADGDALLVYCQAVVHYTEACKLVNTAGLLIKGHDGGVVKNPAVQIVRDTGIMIRVMAGEFGLTPSARVGLTARTERDGPHAERLLSS